MDERKRPSAPVWTRAVLLCVLCLLFLPLVVMVMASFRSSDGAWTLTSYREVWSDQALLSALLRSLAVAFASALGATTLALAAAFVTAETAVGTRGAVHNPLRRPLEQFSTLSLLLPELVLALSLLSWFAISGTQLSLLTVTAAHITLTLPFATFVIDARLKALDPNLGDAARDLGATEAQVFRRITLPLLRPAITAGFLLAFLLSFDDFLVSFYTNGSGSDTLPVRLYSMIKTGLSPKVQALSSLMLLFSLLLIVFLFLFWRRLQRKET